MLGRKIERYQYINNAETTHTLYARTSTHNAQEKKKPGGKNETKVPSSLLTLEQPSFLFLIVENYISCRREWRLFMVYFYGLNTNLYGTRTCSSPTCSSERRQYFILNNYSTRTKIGCSGKPSAYLCYCCTDGLLPVRYVLLHKDHYHSTCSVRSYYK